MSNARNLANLLGTNTKVKDVDVDGTELVLDADGDSSITADTDDRVDIKVAGSDKVHVTSTGLSIGTSSPATDFHVAGASYSAPTNGVDSNINLLINNTQYAGLGLLGANNGSSFIHFGDGDDMDVGQINYVHADNAMTFTTNTSEAMRIDSSGNVGIGASSPDRLMHVASSDGNLARFQRTGAFTGSWDVLLGQLTTGDFTIHDNENSKRAIQIDKLTGSIATAFKIHSGGNASVATTSSGGNSILTLSTGSFTHGIKQFCNNGQVSYHVEVGGATVGSISHSTSSTSYNTSSDYRLKENVVTDWDATTRLKQLKPSRFNFIADADTTVDGFLAHEVSSIVPEAISGDKDAMTKEVLYVDGDEIPEGKKVGDVKTPSQIDPQGIDQSKLVPLLTKALQEAVAKIEILEAKVTALESK